MEYSLFNLSFSYLCEIQQKEIWLLTVCIWMEWFFFSFLLHFLLLILEFIHSFLLQIWIKYDTNVKSGSDHVHRICSTLVFGPKFVYKQMLNFHFFSPIIDIAIFEHYSNASSGSRIMLTQYFIFLFFILQKWMTQLWINAN